MQKPLELAKKLPNPLNSESFIENGDKKKYKFLELIILMNINNLMNLREQISNYKSFNATDN